MTREDIIRMAREAGLSVKPPSWGYTEHYHFAGFEQSFERFAAIVAAEKEKQIIDILERLQERNESHTYYKYAVNVIKGEI